MGPRSFERGNAVDHPDADVAELLQWGRAHSSAEIRCAPAKRDENAERSFNGAALIRARKSATIAARGKPNIIASMGPRSFERGNPALLYGDYVPLFASMGPRSFERGNSLELGPDNLHCVGLQWGRAHSSAEIAYGYNMLIRNVQASMGPRSFERGNHRSSFK